MTQAKRAAKAREATSQQASQKASHKKKRVSAKKGRSRPWAKYLGAVAVSLVIAGAAIGFAVARSHSFRNTTSFATAQESAGSGGEEGVGAGQQALRPRSGKGEKMPSFQLQRLDAEGSSSLDDFEGKPLVVNFWASWCPSCAAELPEFEAVYRRFSPHVEFLGVNLQDSEGAAKALAKRTGVTFSLVSDRQGSLYRDVQGLAMPLTLLVSADGHIVKKVSGELNSRALEKLILEHLLEPAG